jgi:hypothetical protein
LRAAVSDRRDCPARFEKSFLTYEPYAFAITSSDQVFRRLFNAALFEMFADGTAMKLYLDNFDGNYPPESAMTLFRINSIPTGQAVGK